MSDSLLKRLVNQVGVDELVKMLGPTGLQALRYEWEAWARPEQLPPDGDWLVWLLLAGRGFGKSRTAAEWARRKAKELPGSHGAVVAPTAADARDTMARAIVEASSPADGCVYEPSKRSISWLNGTRATLYSAEEPDRLRGPNHAWAICDELAVWAHAGDVWDMLQMTLRIGDRPQTMVTTTPRPIDLLKGDGKDGRRLGIMRMPRTIVTRGSTYDNADNLAPSFLETMETQYEGTRLGRQELHAELLDDLEGALWNRAWFDRDRRSAPPVLRRIVVAVDPAGSAKRTADEAGIVVAGVGPCDCLGRADSHLFVLEDLTDRYSPADMATTAVKAYYRWQADAIVAEDNFGGEIIKDLIRLTDANVAYKRVHASRGKAVRAEPVASLYEARRAHHVGALPKVEDELCSWTPDSDFSPGRLDALVWAGSELMLKRPASFGAERFDAPKATSLGVAQHVDTGSPLGEWGDD